LGIVGLGENEGRAQSDRGRPIEKELSDGVSMRREVALGQEGDGRGPPQRVLVAEGRHHCRVHGPAFVVGDGAQQLHDVLKDTIVLGMGKIGEEHPRCMRSTALGKQASSRGGQRASIAFNGCHAMPGQGGGPAVLARQGPQPRQDRRPDGDKVRTGLLPGIGRRSTQVCDQLIQRTLRGFAALPQLEEGDERGIIGRQHRRVQPGLVRIGRISPPAISGEATRQQRRGQEQKQGSIAHRRRLLAECQQRRFFIRCTRRAIE
jgi:hypothetical protein